MTEEKLLRRLDQIEEELTIYLTKEAVSDYYKDTLDECRRLVRKEYGND
jgi:hypothetical protein